MNLQLQQLEPTIRIVPGEPFSLEQFWRFSEENPDLRMEREPNGDVLVMTPTTRSTGFRSSYINFALHQWAQNDGRGYAFDSSTGFLLPDGSVRSPDAAWISGERWTPVAQDEYDKVLCPDFIIELGSKTDRVHAGEEKMHAWIANGVQLGWLIDPQRRLVEIFCADRAQARSMPEPHSVVAGAPVTGFELKLDSIWGKG